MNQQKRTLVELKLSWAINYNINVCNYMEGFLKLYSDLYHVMITAQRTEIFQIVHALSKFSHKRFYHPHTHTLRNLQQICKAVYSHACANQTH